MTRKNVAAIYYVFKSQSVTILRWECSRKVSESEEDNGLWLISCRMALKLAILWHLWPSQPRVDAMTQNVTRLIETLNFDIAITPSMVRLG